MEIPETKLGRALLAKEISIESPDSVFYDEKEDPWVKAGKSWISFKGKKQETNPIPHENKTQSRV
jgi:hypothetical protein